MHRFRSVGARLSLALAVVVAGALTVVWVALVPTLQHRLVNGRLALLAQSARQISRSQKEPPDRGFVDDAARTADANRAVLYRINASGTLRIVVDTRRTGVFQDASNDAVALRAARAEALERGVVTRGGETFAEVALPDRYGNVLLYSASLGATLENVDLVRSRLIWAGLSALGLAVLVGWGAASLFARRIRRLERAADRIAGGDFEEPVVDRGRDEVGELADAFDRMRIRLAQFDDARRAFIANASHELRTPIFSVGGFLELLREDDLDAETRAEFVEAMAEQMGRLSKLAADLLDLSRLDADGMRIDLEPVELAYVARDLGEELGSLAVRREHLLEVVVAANGQALADRERVLQVGRALVDNALVHTPPGTHVWIVADGTRLRVEDDGPGIPVEHREQIFTRFTRLHGTRASGSGLGLAIARELAERMAGELRVEARPGRTSFVLDLPSAEPAVSTGNRAAFRNNRHE
ncbi:MAG TPA: HAMP domain-containing sensor histidine kinase [Gaiellaceae bacterium]|nr:HAMP domain-containing sensor histidine kinase [Gaiellaceae bacterium]